MSIFNERNVYDRVEDSVMTIVKEAIEDGNINMLQRGLPILAIAEDLPPTYDNEEEEEEDGDEYNTLAIASYDDSDPLMFTPKILQLNEKLVDQLSDEDLVNAINHALRPNEEYVTSTSMGAEELHLLDKDGDAMDPLVVTAQPITIEDEEDEDKTASSTTIDLSAISEAIKKLVAGMATKEEEDEAELTAKIDKYVLDEKVSKIKTIVSKENTRYKGKDLTDDQYEKMLDEVAEVQDILDTAIESSGMSKVASDTPDKRLNIRNVVIGHHKEYFSHKMMYGKEIDIVVALDRSGSMGGKPARDSAIIISALNNLAHKYKELTCTILFSDNEAYDMMNFPVGEMNSRELMSFTQTHGAEGLAENMDKELDRIERADVVFVYTDGDIVSGAVDKPSYTAKGIELVGLYTANASSKDGKLSNEDYARHYTKNKSWFHRVEVSTSSTNLAEAMVEYMTT